VFLVHFERFFHFLPVSGEMPTMIPSELRRITSAGLNSLSVLTTDFLFLIVGQSRTQAVFFLINTWRFDPSSFKPSVVSGFIGVAVGYR
jgi:hypothetical protein